MKKGLIIYNHDEGIKNKAFIELIIKYGRDCDIVFKYVSYELFIKTPEIYIDDVKVLINRTRDYTLSEFCEEKGIKVYNSSFIVRTCNDKFKTINYIKDNCADSFKLNFPKTVTFNTKKLKEYIKGNVPQEKVIEKIYEMLKKLEFDVKVPEINNSLKSNIIIKSLNGHGGNEVILLTFNSDSIISNEDYCTLCNMILSKEKLIAQEYIDSDGQDLRVYVLGGKIYEAVLRKSKEGFKSNYSLGGSISLYNLSKEDVSHIKSVINCFNPNDYSFLGIDFLLDKSGKLIFNEVEEMCGARMLYNLSDKDIVKDMMKNISFFISS